MPNRAVRKTRKAVAKRFKISATGKVKRAKAGRRHLLLAKSAKRKRKLAQAGYVADGDLAKVFNNLPFSKR